MHINERGSHTTVIEFAKDPLKILKKQGVSVSPGKIEASGASGNRSLKIKKINREVSEMVIVAGSSKQTFKVFTEDPEGLVVILKKDKTLREWNVNYMDMSTG